MGIISEFHIENIRLQKELEIYEKLCKEYFEALHEPNSNIAIQKLIHVNQKYLKLKREKVS